MGKTAGLGNGTVRAVEIAEGIAEKRKKIAGKTQLEKQLQN